MIEYNLDVVKELINILVSNKLDCLEVGDIKICKTRWESKPIEKKEPTQKQLEADMDEILFYSTSAPPMSLEDLETITVTPLKAE
jgi:hypothetical protein